jgi:5-methylcytosine-specific restriction endonuclease McrA
LKSKKKPIKKRASPKEWTDARKHAFVVSVLRAGTRRWPPKYKTLAEAKVGKKINSKTGRMAEHYLCATCCLEFPATGIEVDHIEPVVGRSGFSTWDAYIERMFVDEDGFQVLCKGCHKIKTDMEKGERLLK